MTTSLLSYQQQYACDLIAVMLRLQGSRHDDFLAATDVNVIMGEAPRYGEAVRNALAADEITTTRRGPLGGARVVVKPSELTLGRVMRAVTTDSGTAVAPGETRQRGATELSALVVERLDKVTMAEWADRRAGAIEGMIQRWAPANRSAAEAA